MSAASHPIPVEKPQAAPPPRQQPAPERRSRWWVILAAIVVLTGGAYLAWKATGKPEPAKGPAAATPAIRTAVATAGAIQRTTRVTGQTSAIDFANIVAPIMRGAEGGRDMVLLSVAPGGSWVKKGTLVGQIDAQAAQDHIDDLADTITAAENDIHKRKAEQSIERETLQQSLRVAKADFDKTTLEYKGSETQTDITRQAIKLSMEEAEARYRQFQRDIEQKKIAHAAEIGILNITLQRHLRHRDRHIRDLKAFSIYAPMDGLVVMQQIYRGSEFGQVQQGDRVSGGQPFMKIVNTSKMQVEGVINQAQSGEFRVGQAAMIHFDAFPGMQMKGRVHSIGALAVSGGRQGNYVRTVPIRITIEGSDPKLIPDLSASADVVLESASNQTLVPLSAVRVENGKPVVYVKQGDAFQSRAVDVGVRSATHAAIVSGVQPGETVRVN